MLPEGHFFDRVSQRRGGEREEKVRRREERASSFRFAVGVSDSDKPGTVGYQAVNRAVASLGTEPSLAFVTISKAHEQNRKTVLYSVRDVLGEDVPVMGAVVSDPIMHREGITEGGVAVALWSADGHVEIGTHLIKLHNRDVEDLREELAEAFSGDLNRRYLNVLGVAPYFFEGVGERLEEVFLSLSEYVDLAVVGIVGGRSPSPWSIVHGWDFYSSHLSLVTIRTDIPFGVFFAYGFHPLVPMEVTRAEGRFVVEVDNSPAYDVLTDILVSRGIAGTDLKDRSRLRKVLSRFQVAIPDPAAAGRFKTTVIRDITHKGVELGIGVVEGDTVWLMEADNIEVLKSTTKGALRSLSFLKGARPAGLLFFENHTRILALGKDVKRDVEGLKQAIPLPFLGIPSSQELVLHHSVFSGLHSGVAAGVLFANTPEQP